jgi:hypothetical protein
VYLEDVDRESCFNLSVGLGLVNKSIFVISNNSVTFVLNYAGVVLYIAEVVILLSSNNLKQKIVGLEFIDFMSIEL